METGTRPVILIADTSPHILDYLAGAFELSNFEVRTAATAQECIEIFNGIKDKLDIVLLDGAIAGDEGVHVILSLRRQKPEQKIMVVVEEENARVKAMRVGADVVVMKPMTVDAIKEKVNDMLLKTESFLEREQSFNVSSKS